MKYFAAVLAFGLCVDAVGQSLPDTLDNKRYYPLEVGNEWQYTETAWITPIPTYHRSRIVSDTTANGHHYFKRLSESFDAARELQHSAVTYLRYNAMGAVVASSSPSIDTSVADDSLTYWYHANFGDSVETYYGLSIVRGSYDSTLTIPGPNPIRAAAVKTLHVPDPLYGTDYYEAEVVAADIGKISHEVFDGPDTWLSYANIGGVEYGERVIGVHIEGGQHPRTATRTLEIFPNPAMNVLYLLYEGNGRYLPQLMVYDVLGRTVIHAAPSTSCSGKCEFALDISGLSSGVYSIVVTTGNTAAFRSFTVVP